MENLFDPLSEEELEQLDQFLFDRVDEDADIEDKDEGVLDVSELDGLLTALVSGPVRIPPSRWLPVVWGDFEPEWNNQHDFEHVISLMVRHMNSIAAMLMAQPEEYEPIFQEHTNKGKAYTIVDEWCEGYMRGVALAADAWRAAGQEMTNLLEPIRAFTSETDWQAHDMSSGAEIENIQNAIAPNVRKIHAYWLASREDGAPSKEPMEEMEPMRHHMRHVGRNDPCPCGSGKKYKKCCLH